MQAWRMTSDVFPVLRPATAALVTSPAPSVTLASPAGPCGCQGCLISDVSPLLNRGTRRGAMNDANVVDIDLIFALSRFRPGFWGK